MNKLNEKTVIQLKEIARRKSIVGFSKLNKEGLVSAIKSKTKPRRSHRIQFRMVEKPVSLEDSQKPISPEERPEETYFDPRKRQVQHEYCTPIHFLQKEDRIIEGFNCLEIPLEKIKFILGPFVFYKFVLGGRNLYLFGEYHQRISDFSHELPMKGATKNNTVTFSSFVHILATTKVSENFDLMIEKGFEFKEPGNFQHSNSSALNALEQQFYTCLNPEYREFCRYTNLRAHYVDYRRKKDETGTFYSAQEIPVNKNISRTLRSAKIHKQVIAITDPEIQESFSKFIDYMLTERNEDVVLVNSFVMDLYAIPRILRGFSSTTKKTKAFSGTAKNVIYYAGAHHIKIFVDFLTNFLKIKPVFEAGSCAGEGKPEKSYKTHKCISYLQLNVAKNPDLFS